MKWFLILIFVAKNGEKLLLFLVGVEKEMPLLVIKIKIHQFMNLFEMNIRLETKIHTLI